jgi:5-methylcytosine-specific restriction endonuclease McrA
MENRVGVSPDSVAGFVNVGLSGGMRMSNDALIKELIGLGWSKETLAVWQRAKFRCEYCNADLLASVDDYFYGSHVDHIVPGRGNHLDNLALACKTCNFIKSDRNFADDGRDLTRDEIVKKARDLIAEERLKKDKRLQRVRELLPLLT